MTTLPRSSTPLPLILPISPASPNAMQGKINNTITNLIRLRNVNILTITIECSRYASIVNTALGNIVGATTACDVK